LDQTALRGQKQTGFLQVRSSPTNSIVEDELASARQEFASFVIGQFKCLRKFLDQALEDCAPAYQT
jgi:hypothetical protein